MIPKKDQMQRQMPSQKTQNEKIAYQSHCNQKTKTNINANSYNTGKSTQKILRIQNNTKLKLTLESDKTANN